MVTKTGLSTVGVGGVSPPRPVSSRAPDTAGGSHRGCAVDWEPGESFCTRWRWWRLLPEFLCTSGDRLLRPPRITALKKRACGFEVKQCALIATNRGQLAGNSRPVTANGGTRAMMEMHTRFVLCRRQPRCRHRLRRQPPRLHRL